MNYEDQIKTNSGCKRGPESAQIVASIDTVPITVQRKPYQPLTDKSKLAHVGLKDHDSVIYPIDTFRGFYQLCYGIILSPLSVLIIHGNFSYPTQSSFIPDPFFRIYTANIHKDKHGSDTGTYDTEGRFIPQKFEDMFSKYAEGRDYLTLWDVSKLMKGQRLIADPVGWGGAFFEWLATYILLWPEDGRMREEDIRGIYDGSLFYKVAARRAANP
ncbi:hypothetical protein BFJ69_g16191 [Fusarium oxysporum]|uniref:Uncharacterized protein n=1 Tax=Fusarium oxysporum TaxID=5507 RepID=A0A420MBY5_FUSOX|nr:hypothetical protein BFJ69_g16191 [Fusarium oxysporum]